MSAAIEILTNVASTGKTARLLSAYREANRSALKSGEPITTLWLTPTSRARRALLNQLLDDSLSVCFAPNVFTFHAFAEKILQFSAEQTAPLSEVQKRILLRRIIDQFRKENRLSYFSPIAQTSGFLDLAMSFVSELKREEIWPEHFRDACRLRGESSKDRELALIYDEYQKQLLDLGLYDDEGRFWSARTALADGQWGPFTQMSLIVVDGFTDFTHTQYEILSLLAARTARMMIALPSEEPLERSDLFAKSEIARGRLNQMGSTTTSVTHRGETHRPSSDRPALVHIADRLFANPRSCEPMSTTDGIEIIAAGGQIGEIELLAERVKSLLLSGVEADDIVVALRSVDDYADLFEEVFTAAGIPHWCDYGLPLERVPVVKALIAVLELEIEDWSFERLMAVLNSNYFRPAWDDIECGQDVRIIAEQLRRIGLPAQRTAILSVLERQARTNESRGKSGSESGESNVPDADAESDNDVSAQGDEYSIKAAVSFRLLDRLSEATEATRRRHDFATWTKIVHDVAHELGIAYEPPLEAESTTDDVLTKRDCDAWQLFESCLADAVRIEADSDEPSEQVGVAEFVAQLKDLLKAQSIPPGRDESGKVLILRAREVRNLDIRHLFLAGLNESSFPSSRNDDCIYSDSERQQLNEHGITLRHRSSHSQDEMLLFYGVVTRARQNLVLSYPAMSSTGQPLFPSPYLTALRELFVEKALPVTHVDQLDPVPSRIRMLRPADLRLVASTQLRQRDAGLFRAMLDDPEMAATAASILDSAAANDSRFHMRGFTVYEGLLREPQSLKRLGQLFSEQHEFSATELESYAQCPFRFFVSRVLKLEPLPSVDAETDHRSRGTLVHDVLAELHRPPEGLDAISCTVPASDVVQRFRELVNERLQRRYDVSRLQKSLTAIERMLLDEWAEAYGQQREEYIETFRKNWNSDPVVFGVEVPFGTSRHGADAAHATDDASFGCVTFGSGKQKTLIQGRIDRIDCGQAGEQTVFNVIDYKSGKPPKFDVDDVRTGRAIQLALYTIAVRRLLIAGDDSVPYQMAYWSLKETGFVPGLKGKSLKSAKPLDAAALQSMERLLEDLIPRLAGEIRDGAFPVYSQDSDCTRLCPFSTTCRVNQIRPLEDVLNKKREL